MSCQQYLARFLRDVSGDLSVQMPHQVWVEALDPNSWRRETKGFFHFDKVRVEKQSLEETLHFLIGA